MRGNIQLDCKRLLRNFYDRLGKPRSNHRILSLLLVSYRKRKHLDDRCTFDFQENSKILVNSASSNVVVYIVVNEMALSGTSGIFHFPELTFASRPRKIISWHNWSNYSLFQDLGQSGRSKKRATSGVCLKRLHWSRAWNRLVKQINGI